MDIQQLRYFVTIARYGKIQTAAEILFVTRQAVSKAMTQLENELGYPLFDRVPNGVKLTQQGADFIDQARAVVEDFDMLSAQMHLKDMRRQLHIALPFTVHHSFFDQLNAFQEAHAKDVMIDIVSQTDAECHKLFESGAVDMAVSHLRFQSGLDEGKVVASSPMFLAVRNDHRLAGVKTLPMGLPPDRPIIYYVNGYKELSWLTQPQCDYAVNDILLAFDLVRKKNGVFPVPLISVPEFLDGITLVPYEGPDDRDDFYCSISSHVARDPQLRQLCLQLRDALILP